MKIITTPDKRLKEKSEKVGVIDFEVLDTIAEMRKLSLEWEKVWHPYLADAEEIFPAFSKYFAGLIAQ